MPQRAGKSCDVLAADGCGGVKSELLMCGVTHHVCPSTWVSTHHVLYRLGSHERVVRLRAIHLIADCPKQAVAIAFTLLHTKAKLSKALAVLSLPVQGQGRGRDHSAQYSTACISVVTTSGEKRGWA